MATRRFAERYANQIAIGMSDKELQQALEDYLGIFGGSGGPDQISIAYQGAGLKIWGAWHGLNHVTDKPLFQGQATTAMARDIYGIADPQSAQLALF